MKIQVLIFSTILFCASGAQAAQLRSCDSVGAKIEQIVPGSGASYYNGDVGAYLTDLGEPANGAKGIVITVPGKNYEAEGEIPYCFAIKGYRGIDWSHKKVTYDPDTGLLIDVWASRQTAAGNSEDVELKILVNRIPLELPSVILE